MDRLYWRIYHEKEKSNYFLGLIFVLSLFTFCNAEYVVYKIIDGRSVVLTDEREYKQIYDVLMTYQFPMNTNLSFK